MEEIASDYLSDSIVTKAIHANLHGKFIVCNDPLPGYTLPNFVPSIIDSLQKAHSHGLRIMIYNGDADTTSPFMLYRAIADNLGYKPIGDYRPWYYHHSKTGSQQVGGYVQEYVNLTFAFIKGAGHESAMYKPLEAFTLFDRFVHRKRIYM
jgi:hypothetical protein